MIDFLKDYVQSNFALLVLEIILFTLLVLKPKYASRDFRPMYITIICIFAFTVCDRLETLITDDSDFYALRLILSIICYWLRPTFCLGLIYVLVTDKKKRTYVSIPEVINLVVMGAAAIPVVGKYVFYFDADFCFQRGILGYTVFVVGFFYILLLLIIVIFNLHNKKAKESWLIVICAISIIISSLGETTAHLWNVTPTLVVISCLVYYLMVYIQITSFDGLTELYNREIFNMDSKDKNINAAVSIDMNGLKELNDTNGHEAGDAALAAIGKAISRHVSHENKGYRIGGDEFMILFHDADENLVIKTCDKIRNEVMKAGYSIAVGYVMRSTESMEELMKLSDERMYADKEAHYGRVRSRR